MTTIAATYSGSFWADLYTSLHLLAEEVGDRDVTGTTACVLGCSDGKFVIPLAAAGCHVTGVDVDPVMLYGGDVEYQGERIHVRGLLRNLEDEGLSARCEIVEADYMEWQTERVFDFVLTSGSWAYNRNLHHGLETVVSRMQRLVAPGGHLFADYLLPYTAEERALDMYPMPGELAVLFPRDAWHIVHNDDVGLIGERHYPLAHWHYHLYGAFLAERRR